MPVCQHSDDDLPVVRELDELVALVESTKAADLYVRWSCGPAVDLAPTASGSAVSRDGLTGVPLPGLSANPLRVEPWWQERSLRLWVARRLFDYRHLRDLRGAGVRAWILTGAETGRGPDNEPLVDVCRPLAWIDDTVLAECEHMIAEQNSAEWGPLDRSGD
jgi:hypothetical protein